MVVAPNLVVIFAQFAFAGEMLEGMGRAAAIHCLIGVLLIRIALVQTALSIGLRSVRPTW